MTTMQLESADGKVVTIDVEAAKGSGLIKNMLETCGLNLKENILLTDIDSATLELLVNWLQNQKPDIEVMNENSSFNWERSFFAEMDDPKLVEVIRAANFLDISELFEKSCKEAADRLDTDQLILVQLEANKNEDDSEEDSATQ